MKENRKETNIQRRVREIVEGGHAVLQYPDGTFQIGLANNHGDGFDGVFYKFSDRKLSLDEALADIVSKRMGERDGQISEEPI